MPHPLQYIAISGTDPQKTATGSIHPCIASRSTVVFVLIFWNFGPFQLEDQISVFGALPTFDQAAVNENALQCRSPLNFTFLA